MLAPSIDEIRAAQTAIRGVTVRTPLLELEAPETLARVFLKLENLQPIGSFKLRGALNAVAQADPAQLAQGLVTASAGNMAQGVAWAARSLGVPATVIVSDQAPEVKLAAIARLGARSIKVPFERWWQTLEEGRFEGVDGLFIHPFEDQHVIAGNGTIGLEILEDLPDPDFVLVPCGGGGLIVGIACALQALSPSTRVVSVEPDVAAPMRTSLEAGERRPAANHRHSFVDGSGGPSINPAMWELARERVHHADSPSLDEVAAAIRVLVQRVRVVAEGAGALGVATALSGRVGAEGQRVVCVVSGGNIDPSRLAMILGGETPG